MATITFTLTGDQIATYTSLTSSGSDVTIDGISTLGTSSDVYTIVVEENPAVGTHFTNGQKISIYDSDGNLVVADMNPKSSQYGGSGAGDEHVLFTGPGTQYVFDLGGFTGTSVTYTSTDETANPGEGDNDGEFDFNDVPCFTPGTMIRTPDGERAVEDLKPGDLVSALDSGSVPVVWVQSREVDFQKMPDKRRSVAIAGAPGGPLVVSAQHRILRKVNGAEVLIPAIALIDEEGVEERVDEPCTTYCSVLTPEHEVIWANGLECETFYPGAYIMASMPRDMRAELFGLYPLLRFGAEMGYGPGARPFLNMRKRPVRNAVRQKPLTMAAAE